MSTLASTFAGTGLLGEQVDVQLRVADQCRDRGHSARRLLCRRDDRRFDLVRHPRHRQYRASGLHHPRLLHRLHRQHQLRDRPDPRPASSMLPVFYSLGAGVYQVYYQSFEKRGQEALRGLAFFFGLLFVTEVLLILVFGVDYRYVEAGYIGPTLQLRRHRFSAAHAGAVRRRAAHVRRAAALPVAHLHRPRHHGGGAGSTRAAADGASIRPASSASPSASRSRPRRSPARS